MERRSGCCASSTSSLAKPRHPCGQEVQGHGRHRCAMRSVRLAGHSGPYPFRQGPEFVAGASRMDRGCWRQDRLHRTRKSMGERILRELQRQAARRTAQRRNLLHVEGGQIMIESWRRHYNKIRPHSSLGYRPPAPEASSGQHKASGANTAAKLTLQMDHRGGRSKNQIRPRT